MGNILSQGDAVRRHRYKMLLETVSIPDLIKIFLFFFVFAFIFILISVFGPDAYILNKIESLNDAETLLVSFIPSR
jgi:hypothetical protein